MSFNDLKGLILDSVSGAEKNSETIVFKAGERTFVMYHEQNCCERVSVEDVCGDINDIIGSEIILADEITSEGEEEYGDSYTWTFYHIRTNNGTVSIRWYGSSNGYYSESVTFEEIKRDSE